MKTRGGLLFRGSNKSILTVTKDLKTKLLETRRNSSFKYFRVVRIEKHICPFVFYEKLQLDYFVLRSTDLKSRFAVRSGKKSPCQETCLGNRGHLKALNDIELVLIEHE